MIAPVTADGMAPAGHVPLGHGTATSGACSSYSTRRRSAAPRAPCCGWSAGPAAAGRPLASELERTCWVRLDALDWNACFSFVNDRVLRDVDAPYVLVLNPDTEVFAGALDHMVEVMEERPDVGMSSCRLEQPDGDLRRLSYGPSRDSSANIAPVFATGGTLADTVTSSVVPDGVPNVPPSDRRRVLMVFHEAVLGGACRAVLRAIPQLEARGWEFVFWVPLGDGLQDELAALGYEHGGAERLLRYRWRSLKSPPGVAARLWSFPGYLRRFRAFEASQQPAIVHMNTVLTLPELLAIGARRPSVMFVHEILPESWAATAAGRVISAATDVVLAPSDAAAAVLRAHRVNAQVIRPGIDVPPETPERRTTDPRLVVGMLGTVCRRKGSDLFVAASERVAHLLPDVEFRMFGRVHDGAEQSWAEEIVRSARARGIACGTTADVFAELAEWDMLVMPSRNEPYGLAPIEAMAMGLPVIAANVDGLRELVDSSTGMLFPSEDVGALSDAIVALGRDPDRRAQLGAAGRARVTQELSLERQADGMHRAYLAALGAHSARSQPRRAQRPAS